MNLARRAIKQAASGSVEPILVDFRISADERVPIELLIQEIEGQAGEPMLFDNGTKGLTLDRQATELLLGFTVAGTYNLLVLGATIGLIALAARRRLDQEGGLAWAAKRSAESAAVLYGWAERSGFPVKELSAYTAWQERMMKRPTVQKSVETEQNVSA